MLSLPLLLATMCALGHSASATLLLMSVHDSPYNLLAIDSSKQRVISESVLDLAELQANTDDLAWRGVIQSNQTLFVANSKKKESFIVAYNCYLTNTSASGGTPQTLQLQEYFTKETDGANSGLDHPYDMANTNSVIMYDGFGNAVTGVGNGKYPGSIVSYKVPDGENGVRGIAVDTELGLMFVNVEYDNVCYVYDISALQSGTQGASPVLVYQLEYKGASTFIDVDLDTGAKIAVLGDSHHDALVAFDYGKTSARQKWVASDVDKLNHPAGIQVDAQAGIVYVVSQNENAVLSFHKGSGAYVGVVCDFSAYGVLGENLYALPEGQQCANK